MSWIAFCLSQAIPLACLSERMEMHFIWTADRAQYGRDLVVDHRWDVINGNWWRGDCDDYAATAVAVADYMGIEGGVVLRCASRRHRVALIDGWVLDSQHWGVNDPANYKDCERVGQ